MPNSSFTVKNGENLLSLFPLGRDTFYHRDKAKLLQQLNRTQFPSLGIFVSNKVGNQKN